MKKWLIGSLLVVLPLAGLAQHIAMPEFYDVRGVDASEKLNIRAEPNARSSVVDTLAHDATAVEVVAIEGNWAQINAGEGSGWVSLSYLEPQPSVWKNAQLPSSLSCFGTEPFWNVTFKQGEVQLTMPDQAEQRFAIESVTDRGYPEDRLRAVQAGQLSAVIVPKACSDGMSDRSYALEAVILPRRGQHPLLSGCCTIVPSKSLD